MLWAVLIIRQAKSNCWFLTGSNWLLLGPLPGFASTEDLHGGNQGIHFQRFIGCFPRNTPIQSIHWLVLHDFELWSTGAWLNINLQTSGFPTTEESTTAITFGACVSIQLLPLVREAEVPLFQAHEDLHNLLGPSGNTHTSVRDARNDARSCAYPSV